MEDQKLKAYFKFDEVDLTANRNGAFSDSQRRKLASRQSGAIRQKKIVSRIGIPLSLLLLGGMGYLIYQGTVSGTQTNSVAIFWMGLCGLPMLVASLYIFRLSLIQQKYLLKRAEGPINIVKESTFVNGHTYTRYDLHVDGKKFQVTSELGDVLRQGDTYAIYYSEGSVSGHDEILSAERIASAG